MIISFDQGKVVKHLNDANGLISSSNIGSLVLKTFSKFHIPVMLKRTFDLQYRIFKKGVEAIYF